MDLVSELKGDLCIVTNALAKIKEEENSQNSPDKECETLSLTDDNIGDKENKTVDIEEIQNAFDDLNVNLNWKQKFPVDTIDVLKIPIVVDYITIAKK